jgi:phosphonate transport system permease protein
MVDPLPDLNGDPLTDIQEKITLFEHHRSRIEHKKYVSHIIYGLIFLICFVASCWIGRVDMIEFIQYLPDGWNYIKELIPVIRPAYLGADLAEWYGRGEIWAAALFDTIIIAILATFFGALGALVISFPASRNLMESSTTSRTIYFFCRRFMEVERGVPELVYAMMFVFAFNLGPFPGALAIGVHTMGALGKLFSEVNENIDQAQMEGAKATGANWIQTIRYAVIPQVMPNFLSYTILRFEINIRAASIIGLVGAGGIGVELMFAIRQFQYTDISAIVLMIMLVVFVLDFGCEQLRHYIIGKEQLI